MAKDKGEVLGEIRGSFTQGVKYYNSGNLLGAETEFVKALRPLMSKPIMKAIHPGNIEGIKVELLRSMYHLGEIYLRGREVLKAKYGECTDYHSKAAAIFQYCSRFAEKYNATIDIEGKVADSQYFVHKSYDVERDFLAQASGVGAVSRVGDESYYENYRQKIEHYKSELANIRTAVRERLNDISEPNIEQITERSVVVEDIYRESSQFFVDHQSEPMGLGATLPDTPFETRVGNGFIQRLLQECYEQLGPVPERCQYSIIALGSLSLGTMTPWSDLEFAILVNQDREGYKEDYKEYFRNLTKLLHIKTINLGETPLQSVGIESLNNFRTANVGDDWFLDDITTKGFGFDSVIWRACKNPLGRQGGYRVERKVQNDQGIEEVIFEDKPDYELILTPEEMAVMQFAEAGGAPQAGPSFTSDRYLVQALRSNALIDGSQALLDDYRARLRSEDPQQAQMLRTQSLEILKEDVNKFSLKLGDKEEGKLIDVKNGIYRLGDRVVNELASCYDITEELGQAILTVWQKIEAMQSRGVISIDGARHLKEAISIATELRLRTYSHNDGQSEGMSSYIPAVEHLTEEEKHQLLEKTFHIKDTSILHHFYYVMLRVQQVVQGFCDQGQALRDEFQEVLTGDDLYEDSSYYKAMVHARFLEFSKALENMEVARDKEPDNLRILQDLFFLCDKTQTLDKIINLGQKILGVIKIQNQFNTSHQYIAMGYNNLGNAYNSKGEYDMAIACHQKALEIFKTAYISMPNHSDIAISYNNLGNAHKIKGEYDMAIACYQKALEIFKTAYISMPNHSDIATTRRSLGETYRAKGEYDASIDEYTRCLSIYDVAYASMPNHPDIGGGYASLGNAYNSKGEYDTAIECHQKALEIFKIAYTSMPNHPYIAVTYISLGIVYNSKGEYDVAIECHQKALEIYNVACSSMLDHPRVVGVYNSLGNIYRAKGEYDMAIECHQKVLERYKVAYASMPNHPDIGGGYASLGNAYNSKGEYDMAIECYQKALEIFKTPAPNHHYIATIYNNLGNAYNSKGEYDVAIECHQKALEIYNAACALMPNHPDIGLVYGNLGNTYRAKGEYDASIDEYTRCLSIYDVAYASMPNHPDIGGVYNGLGNTYRAKGEYDMAIECHQKALEIFKIAYASMPGHPDIAMSYNNLGIAYFCKGEFQMVLPYSQNGSPMWNSVLMQLGNQSLLVDDFEKAKGYYIQVNIRKIEQIDLASEIFVKLQILARNEAYEISALPAAINCQRVLIKVDPELRYGNHYHNLACFYAIQGNVEGAKSAFLQGLKHHGVTSGLHAEYAQFLILNKDNPVLSDSMETISEHLYSAIASENVGGLSYGRIERSSVCEVLSNLIRQTNAAIQVNPKVLAYYLLITHPEYILEGPGTVDALLETFRDLAIELSDEISAILFVDAEASIASGQVVEVAEDEHTADLGSAMDDLAEALLSGQVADEIDRSSQLSGET